MFGYDVIVTDVPAKFELYNPETGGLKSAGNHYDLMTDEEIMALRVGELAHPHCLLLYWTTGWAMATGRATKIVQAWGFKPLTELAWRKTTRTGKVRMGPGYRVRTMHEPILVAALGDQNHKPLKSLFDGLARQHSRKPDEFYAMVERATPKAFRCDLFARQSRPGFDTWGHESTKFDKGATDEQSTKRRPPASAEPSGRAGALGIDLFTQ